MTKAVRLTVLVLFGLTLVSSVFMTGCTRYAKEEQLTALDETEASMMAAENMVADLEKEKAELQAQLDALKAELKGVQQEKEMVRARL